MKKVILSFVLISLFFSSTMLAQQKGELTLVSCFKIDNMLTLDLELEGALAIECWDKDYVKIEVQITSDTNKSSIIRALNYLERYKIDYSASKFAAVIMSMPNLRKIVTVNSRNYVEELSFKVYVPHGMIINDLYAVDDLLIRAQ